MSVERLHRAAELARGLGGGAQAIGRRWRSALPLCGIRGVARALHDAPIGRGLLALPLYGIHNIAQDAALDLRVCGIRSIIPASDFVDCLGPFCQKLEAARVLRIHALRAHDLRATHAGLGQFCVMWRMGHARRLQRRCRITPRLARHKRAGALSLRQWRCRIARITFWLRRASRMWAPPLMARPGGSIS